MNVGKQKRKGKQMDKKKIVKKIVNRKREKKITIHNVQAAVCRNALSCYTYVCTHSSIHSYIVVVAAAAMLCYERQT